MTLKELLEKKSEFSPGHRTCQGCAIPNVVRHVLRASEQEKIVACATGCLEVTTTLYPETSWRVPWIHSAFENVAPTLSGVMAAWRALKKKREKVKDYKFVAFAGDGATYDIGLQALSGAWERKEDFVYVCYDNQSYSNTGGQRSSATPYGASTTTTPPDHLLFGKTEPRKDIIKIALAHDLPYIAQAAIHNWPDLYQKAKKAFEIKGPCFLNILSPCVVCWGFEPHLSIQLSKLAAETCFWPLYEIENGKWKLNYQPKEKLPLTEFLKPQKRFKHLFKPGNEKVLVEMQNEVDKKWMEICSFTSQTREIK